MPELLEVEMYRRGIETLVGETIVGIDAPDDWYLKGTDVKVVRDSLIGAQLLALDRIGKLLLFDTSTVTVGLRFGMTGRPVIDDEPVIDQLEYSSKRLDPAWNRFTFHFSTGRAMAMNDPRRLGGIELSPDLRKLGPDAWHTNEGMLVALFARYKVSAKGLLLNQKRLAGLGNLLADELLWRSGVAPTTSANEVPTAAVARLAAELTPMLDELYKRGGSNCGDLFSERSSDGRCPRDGSALRHDTVGGRSTWWCAKHQH